MELLNILLFDIQYCATLPSIKMTRCNNEYSIYVICLECIVSSFCHTAVIVIVIKNHSYHKIRKIENTISVCLKFICNTKQYNVKFLLLEKWTWKSIHLTKRLPDRDIRGRSTIFRLNLPCSLNLVSVDNISKLTPIRWQKGSRMRIRKIV